MIAGRAPCEEGLIRAAGGGGGGLSKAGKRWVLSATVLGSSLAFIDGSVVNVALPTLQQSMAADPAEIQWVVNAYMLMLGALVLIGGAAADRYGRRLVFLMGLGLFTAASLGCALAWNVESLVALRAAQGAGAALLTPASLAILGSSFDDRERGAAVGAWAGFGALAAALGPVLGGVLVDQVSWRAIFLLNLPLAGVAAALALRHVRESTGGDARALDWPGAALAALGLGGLTFGLSRASERALGDPSVWGPATAGALVFAGFIAWQARARHPMVPLGLFRSRLFSGVNLLTLLLYFALGGAFYFLPFLLMRLHGYSAAGVGAALLPFALVMGVFSGFAGKLADRVGARLPLTAGPLIAGAGFVLLTLPQPGQPYWTGFFPALLTVAAGMTLAVGPLTSAVMGAVGAEHVGAASGVNSAVARIAGLLAVAGLSVLFAKVFAAHAGGDGVSLARVMAGADASAEAKAAFQNAYRVVMWCAAGCAAIAGIAGWLSRGAQRGQVSGEAASTSPAR